MMKFNAAATRAARMTVALALISMSFIPTRVSAQELDKTKMQACPFSSAEIKKAVGFDVNGGKPTEIAYPEGRMLSCSYASPNASTVLMLSQTWIPAKIFAATFESMDRYSGGKWVAIAGDSDKARWQLDADQKNNLALQYTRKNVRTELRVQGGRFAVEEMQPKLLKLRRVP